jgi:hypothetical protein
LPPLKPAKEEETDTEDLIFEIISLTLTGKLKRRKKRRRRKRQR